MIGGKYRLERPLARGGMGSVWVARHVQLGAAVAVKFLDPSFAASAPHRARFEREARAAANLKSPHVVHVSDYGFEGAAPYLVMELLEGEDLGQRLQRVRRMSLPEAARIVAQAGKALRKAHEAGIVHRDLKPANLFLARVDDDEVVKVLDFGIAKDTGAAIGEATRTGEVMGSPHYMSPEQVRAEKDLDHRTDLWSLGVILYRAVVGVLPFPGDQLGPVLAKILTDPVPVPSHAAPDLAEAVDAFFARALARDRAQRFQSVGELVEAFQRVAGVAGAGAGATDLSRASFASGAGFASGASFAMAGTAAASGPAALGASGAVVAGGAGGTGGAVPVPAAVPAATMVLADTGPQGASGSGPLVAPVGSTGAMATTGPAARPKGAAVAVVLGGAAVLALVVGVAFLVVRPSTSEGGGASSAPRPASELATATATVLVVPTVPAAGASAEPSASAESSASASSASVSSASASSASASSASASPAGASKPPAASTTPRPTAPAVKVPPPPTTTAKPKEKWF